jgi:hypothetical protein
LPRVSNGQLVRIAHPTFHRYINITKDQYIIVRLQLDYVRAIPSLKGWQSMSHGMWSWQVHFRRTELYDQVMARFVL